MKNFLVMLIVTILAGPAAAQEQQVYPRLAPSASDSPAVQVARQKLATVAGQQNQKQPTYRSQPLVKSPEAPLVTRRDPYVAFNGQLPRHPGDYRDAQDRGEWGTEEEGNTGTPSVYEP